LKRAAIICLTIALNLTRVAAGAPAAEPARVLTFIEVRADSIDKGRMTLGKYESALARHRADLRIEILEEIGRPERFVVLESAARAEDLATAEAAAQDNLAPLNELLTALPDRRTNREFAAAANTMQNAAPKHSDRGADHPGGGPPVLYVVAHLDLGPPDQARGAAALQGLVAAARRAPGNLRFEAWQQTNRPNHFNLVEVWSSRTGFDDFTAGAAAREYRATVGPLIGSPYDERLCRRIEPDTK
jgi:quinol monooxygenase YgiN